MDIEEKNKLVQQIILEERQKEKAYSSDAQDLARLLGRIADKKQLARELCEVSPMYYDEMGNWWRWDLSKLYWRIVDEIDILLSIDACADANIINSKEKGEILTALKMEARKRKPIENPNLLQFDKEIINIETGDRTIADSKYFITNPIPFKLGRESNTPKFDKLFQEWVKEDDVQKLYEIIGYCFLPAYPIERIFCLLGSGSNGKSTYLKILYTILGLKNICTTDLHTLANSRFETTRLFKKSACIMSETDLASIESSQKIKKLVSGKDPVSIEFKNKGLTEFINTAKIIIATNNLPPTEDKTDGFYRRWCCIDFPNQFEKEIDVLGCLTIEDYENLAYKSFLCLLDVLKQRGFSKEGNIAERRKVYEAKSNPFDKFFAENVEESPNGDIPKWEFSKRFNDWAKDNMYRTFSDIAIAKKMKEKGISEARLIKEWNENNQMEQKLFRCWIGVKWI